MFQLRNSYQSSNLISRPAGTIWILTKKCVLKIPAEEIKTYYHSSYLAMILLIGLLFMIQMWLQSGSEVSIVSHTGQVMHIFFASWLQCPQNLSHLTSCFSVCDLPGILFQRGGPMQMLNDLHVPPAPDFLQM